MGVLAHLLGGFPHGCALLQQVVPLPLPLPRAQLLLLERPCKVELLCTTHAAQGDGQQAG